ncbi:MAG: hypothetical protein GXO36_03635, partial [Chloroflexi bacterium]|nr:hypothetical protein [Chloroflexota bacterium]
KDQWPNLSDRITTVWTLQDFGQLPQDLVLDVPVRMSDGALRNVAIYTNLAALPARSRDPFVQAAQAESQTPPSPSNTSPSALGEG